MFLDRNAWRACSVRYVTEGCFNACDEAAYEIYRRLLFEAHGRVIPRIALSV